MRHRGHSKRPLAITVGSPQRLGKRPVWLKAESTATRDSGPIELGEGKRRSSLRSAGLGIARSSLDAVLPGQSPVAPGGCAIPGLTQVGQALGDDMEQNGSAVIASDDDPKLAFKFRVPFVEGKVGRDRGARRRSVAGGRASR